MTDDQPKQDIDALAAGHPDNVSGAALQTDTPVALGLDRGDTTEVIPPEGKQSEVAEALNDAADDLGMTARVQWVGDRFVVPPEVAEKANLGGAQTVDIPAQGPTVAEPTRTPDQPARRTRKTAEPQPEST